MVSKMSLVPLCTLMRNLFLCVCVCVWACLFGYGVPEMELRHRAHAAANRGSAVFKQWTTGSLSFPLTALSHSSFLNLFYSFLTFCSQSFSIILTLCSFSFYSGAFSLHPSPMLQFPVDSDNECMVLLPCSHFLCELHAVMPSQKWFKSSGRAHQRCCSCPLGRNKSRSLQSLLWMGPHPWNRAQNKTSTRINPTAMNPKGLPLGGYASLPHFPIMLSQRIISAA